MSETQVAEKSAAEKKQFLADIQRLWMEGLANQEIADELGVERRIIGRNLRELKKRWTRAAARQSAILNQTQCATVYREAMDGWQRSQKPKVVTVEEHKTDEQGRESTRTVKRQEEGPGDKTFLRTAVAALKTLRRFAAEPKPAAPARDDRSVVNAIAVDLLELMTPEQANSLSNEQVHKFRHAIDARRKELQQRRRDAEARRDDEEERDRAPDGVHEADQAGQPQELRLETLAEMLDRVATGKCRRLMVFMPPQHGKSELVSRRFPAFMLGKNPDALEMCTRLPVEVRRLR